MDEGQSRARRKHGPEYIAHLRRFALNLLSANPDRISTRGKIERTGLDKASLVEVLHAARYDRRDRCGW